MDRQRANRPGEQATEAPRRRRPAEPAILALQRTAGNAAVCRALLAREDEEQADAPITDVTVTPRKASMPLDAGVSITAAAVPATGTGDVKFSLAAGSVAPVAGTTIDATTGVVTLAAKQPGGTLEAKADNRASSYSQPFQVVEKPKEIASTTSATTGEYAAQFTHTFSSRGAGSPGLGGGNVNERFDATSVKSPFGGTFTLVANQRNSQGWDLDASGAMTGPDNVSIDTAAIDGGKFVKSASNPKPAQALPVEFSMNQKLHARTYPAGTLEDAPFTTTDHVRRLIEEDGKLKVQIAAGKATETMDYAGPAVFRNAKADKTTVAASDPRPAKGKWVQNEVQVSVDGEGKSPTPRFSLVGEALGCSVGASSGLVKIGDKPGSITVRAGSSANYDEVQITVTAPPAAKPADGAKPEAQAPDLGVEAPPTDD